MLIKGRTDAGTDAVIMGEKLPYTKPCNIWLIQGRYLRGGRLGKTRAVTINNPPTHWLTRLMIIWSSATAVTAFHIRPNSWYMSCGRNITSTCRNNQILFIWFSCFFLFVCSPIMFTLIYYTILQLIIVVLYGLYIFLNDIFVVTMRVNKLIEYLN